MTTATVEDVQARLPELLDRVAAGEEVVITRDGRPVATLKAHLPKGVPIFGRGKGKVLHVAPDFDAPLDDFREHTE
jgi:antitoxin (DNA-binding transcriptional repressor) of toxin-antitoxin stability system